MKKSFFQKTYNLIINLTIIGLICSLAQFCLGLFYQAIELGGLSQYNNSFILINDSLDNIKQVILIFSISTLAISSILVIGQLLYRIAKDSIWNYFKSVYQTIRMRQFLKQVEYSEPIVTIENQTITRFNPVLSEFNQSVRKCTVDIRQEEVSIFLKLPRIQQAQKLLKDMEEHIKEEISNYNPNYYFSTPLRVGNKLWFKGTKR
jgi:putative membrane protein